MKMKLKNAQVLSGLLMVALSAAPASATITICFNDSNHCTYPTCCNGDYMLWMANDTGSDVDVLVTWKVWTCVGAEDCSPLPAAAPTYQYCDMAQVEHGTDCSPPTELYTLDPEPVLPCTCTWCTTTSDYMQGAGHTIYVEVWSGCDLSGFMPDACDDDDVDTRCSMGTLEATACWVPNNSARFCCCAD